jgi:hypothetical protein
MRAEYPIAPFGGASSPNGLVRPPVSTWVRRDWLTALAATLAVWAVAASLWPLTGSVVPWDSKNHFYPMLRFLAAALADGELPLWNPFHFSGHPAVADPQSLLFTPTMMLFGWLVPAPSMQLFDVVVFAHLLPGAIGILGLFSRRSWAWQGAVVAAAIFMLGGSASARLQHTGIMFGYGCFPLALWLLEEALARRSYRFSTAFAVVASFMVIGRDQVAFLAGVSLMAYVAYAAAVSERPLAFLKERAGVLAFAGLIGAALLAVPVLLTLQFLTTSTRPSFGFGVAAMGSLPPESLATILFGDIFGSLRWTYDYWGPDWHSVTEGTWTDRATNYLFAGTAPALLLVWHGVAGGRLFARELRFFLLLLAVSVLYALGRYTPVFSVVFDALPGVALYRRPADATFLINVGLAISAGYLVHRFLRDGNPSLAALRRSSIAAFFVVVAVGLVLAAISSGLLFAVRAEKLAPAGREVVMGLAAAFALAWCLVAAGRGPRSRTYLAAGLLLVTGGELVWRHAASAMNAEPAERYAVFGTMSPEQRAGLSLLQRELAERKAAGEQPRVEVLGLGGAWQNASMVFGLEDTIGYNPLRLSDYEKAIGPGENAVDPNLRQFPGTFRGYRCRLATLLGLEYLVLDRPFDKLPRHFPRLHSAKLIYGTGSMWIYRLESVAPRAYLASQAAPVDSEAVLAEAETPEFDRRTTALVEQDQIATLSPDRLARDNGTEPEPAAGSVTIREYRRNSVVLDVQADRGGIVVLHDIFYPGWEASVDGERATILRTNLLFRGVEVGPGRHVVEFHFRPLAPGNLLATVNGLFRHDPSPPIRTALN